MRKVLLFVLLVITIVGYIYKSKTLLIDSRGLIRLLVSIRIAIVVALAIFSKKRRPVVFSKYWVLVPLVLTINAIIITAVKKHRKNKLIDKKHRKKYKNDSFSYKILATAKIILEVITPVALKIQAEPKSVTPDDLKCYLQKIIMSFKDGRRLFKAFKI